MMYPPLNLLCLPGNVGGVTLHALAGVSHSEVAGNSTSNTSSSPVRGLDSSQTPKLSATNGGQTNTDAFADGSMVTVSVNANGGSYAVWRYPGSGDAGDTSAMAAALIQRYCENGKQSDMKLGNRPIDTRSTTELQSEVMPLF
jgi:hypothetical protein